MQQFLYFDFVLKSKKSVNKLLIAWIFLWITIATATLFPEATSFFASILGIGRGSDLAIYLSLILLYYICFRLYLKLENIQNDIKELVSKLALRNEK